jgi:hypothetical protein
MSEGPQLKILWHVLGADQMPCECVGGKRLIALRRKEPGKGL